MEPSALPLMTTKYLKLLLQYQFRPCVSDMSTSAIEIYEKMISITTLNLLQTLHIETKVLR